MKVGPEERVLKGVGPFTAVWMRGSAEFGLTIEGRLEIWQLAMHFPVSSRRCEGDGLFRVCEQSCPTDWLHVSSDGSSFVIL